MNLPELLQSLDADALIELFVLDTSVIGGSDILRFHNGTSATSSPIVWQGNTYTPWAIEGSGWDKTTKGTLPRPRLRAANISGALFLLLETYDDLVGAKVVRKRTFARYLDGQPTADPGQHYEDETYFVERKTSAGQQAVEWELVNALDLMGMQLPARQILADGCPWTYRGSDCGYVGTAYYNTSDKPVGSAALDVCGKRQSSCKLRFPGNQVMPFGGFPAARTYKV